MPKWGLVFLSALLLSMGHMAGMAAYFPSHFSAIYDPLFYEARSDIFRSIETSEAHRLWSTQGALFVDARSPRSFSRAHIPGATLFYYRWSLQPFLDQVDRSQLVVVYCFSAQCPMAERLASRFLQAGYHRVLLYPGGVAEWREAGYSLEGHL